MKNLFALSLLFVLTFSACAQPGMYSTSNKKAIKKYEEAIGYYKGYQLDLAQLVLEELTHDHSDFAEAYFLLAQIHIEKKNYKEAIPLLNQGLKVNNQVMIEAYYTLAECYFKLAEYDNAEKAATGYIRAGGKGKLLLRTELILESCVFAKDALKHPVNFNPKNLGSTVNSQYDEYYPCITADEKTLLFTRLIPSKNSPEKMQEDFFLSSRLNDTTYINSFSEAEPVVAINSTLNEGAPCLSADGQTMIFTACELDDSHYFGPRRTGLGRCDLFVSLKTPTGWTREQPLDNVNSYSWESQPSFSADGSTLYFVRIKTTKTGSSDSDIYMSQINEYGDWSNPVPIPGKVNTPWNEESVCIHPDGQTLYFSSEGHPGMGGLDIFVSRKGSDGNWGTPINLGYPINTAGDENSIQVTAQGQIALMASTRENGYGGLDLYSFELPKFAQPTFTSYIEGIVFEAGTKKPLNSHLELIDLSTGQVVAGAYAEAKQNGHFLMALPMGKDYALNATSEGYLFSSSNFSLQNHDNRKPYRLDIPLEKIQKDASVVLENIFFATNKSTLEKASGVELQKLVKYMASNATLRIRIEGHTDSDGDEAANMKLSQERSESVRSYLISNGIAADRIEAQGFGETQPIAPNTTPEGKAKNRRTAFRVI